MVESLRSLTRRLSPRKTGLTRSSGSGTFPVGRWTGLLSAAGFGSVATEIIDAPVFGKPSTVLVRASST